MSSFCCFAIIKKEDYLTIWMVLPRLQADYKGICMVYCLAGQNGEYFFTRHHKQLKLTSVVLY